MDAATSLKTARIESRLSQRVLARRAGTSQAQISKIESGQTSPSVRTLDRLMFALGRSLEISSSPLQAGNRTDADVRREAAMTKEERFLEAAKLSEVLTSFAAAGHIAKQRTARDD